MKTLYKSVIIFLTITGVSSIMLNFSDFQLKNIDYFDKHGWFFLVGLAFFPRLSLFVAGLFNNIAFGGLFWWLGFFFAPRFLVATLATISYWNTNKILVFLSWLIALGGESSEKVMISRRMSSGPKRYTKYEGKTFESNFEGFTEAKPKSNTSNNKDVIEVEYKVKE